MDHLQRFSRQIRRHLFLTAFLVNLLIMGFVWAALEYSQLSQNVIFGGAAVLVLLASWLVSSRATSYITKPLHLLWQAVLHMSPEHTRTPPPNMEQLKLGKQLVTNLILQIYQLAGGAAGIAAGQAPAQNNDQVQTILNSLPLPTIALDRELNIIFVNPAANNYLAANGQDLRGQNVYSLLDLSFSSQPTLDTWLDSARQEKLTATHTWEHVRLKTPNLKDALQLDLAAYYNKDNPEGVEIIINLFDHTARYSREDNSLSFIALAVHELRTPLTLLRGYIDVFNEKLSGQLDPELTASLNKMQTSAQQLAAFVNNILNVARLEADQMTLQLQEEKWGGLVKGVVEDMALRAKVQGKTIDCQIAANLPSVAVDRISISEVLVNLLDNAIKYSGASKQVLIKTAVTKDGLIETSVQDYGVGIPDNVLPHLFEKFYRNFKTKEQVSGTGLGLYLSKAIVNAHGGNIWVTSKEGQGTTISFTIKPFSQFDKEQKAGAEPAPTGARGWIKNHSLYRR